MTEPDWGKLYADAAVGASDRHVNGDYDVERLYAPPLGTDEIAALVKREVDRLQINALALLDILRSMTAHIESQDRRIASLESARAK